MSTAVRVNALSLSGTGPRTLPGMQAHGLRQDRTGQARRVRDTPPLVHGSLDLRAAFDAHVAGARMNKALRKPVLHAIVQFPITLPLSAERERWMLDEAVAFVDRTYGGRAVFAARLDRDEDGRHTVDVFASPRYAKVTRRGSQDWISTTKHGRELCQRHRAEIERRHGGRFLDGPRQVGIALQSEWRAHLAEAAHAAGLDLDLVPKREKAPAAPDRMEPEHYKLVQDAKRLAVEVQNAARRRDQARREEDAAVAKRTEAEAAAIHIRAEADRDRAAAASSVQSAEVLVAGTTSATAAIVAGVWLPKPTPGQWRNGPEAKAAAYRFQAHKDRIEAVTHWPEAVWSGLCRLARGLMAAAAAAMADRDRAREQLAQAAKWQAVFADRLGIPTVDPDALDDAIANLDAADSRPALDDGPAPGM